MLTVFRFSPSSIELLTKRSCWGSAALRVLTYNIATADWYKPLPRSVDRMAITYPDHDHDNLWTQISRIRHIHSKGYLFRDVKPENFVIGRLPEKRHMIYVIDCGLAKRYRDPMTQCHIPYREQKQMTGTVRYVSINIHLGRGLDHPRLD